MEVAVGQGVTKPMNGGVRAETPHLKLCKDGRWECSSFTGPRLDFVMGRGSTPSEAFNNWDIEMNRYWKPRN
jgi:hypothetical protein